MVTAVKTENISFDLSMDDIDDVDISGIQNGETMVWDTNHFVPGSFSGTVPSATGNSGKFLTNNGTTTNWGVLSGPLTGTATNDDAAAGKVGEYVTASLASGSAASLTTGNVENLTSISLTAGDWDVSGWVAFVTAGSTSVSDRRCGISTVSAAMPSAGSAVPHFINPTPAAVFGVVTASFPTGTGRIKLATTTTVYLVARGTFTASTLSAYGSISARRVR